MRIPAQVTTAATFALSVAMPSSPNGSASATSHNQRTTSAGIAASTAAVSHPPTPHAVAATSTDAIVTHDLRGDSFRWRGMR